MRTHEGPHGGENYDPDCYGCTLQAKGFTLGPGALPSRKIDSKKVQRPMQEPSWEKGLAGETRRDGSFMPYLDSKLNPIGVKQMADQRGSLEATRHRQLHDPNYGKG